MRDIGEATNVERDRIKTLCSENYFWNGVDGGSQFTVIRHRKTTESAKWTHQDS